MTRCACYGGKPDATTQNGVLLIGCATHNRFTRILPHRLEQDPLYGWKTRTCTKCHNDFQYVLDTDQRTPPQVCASCKVVRGNKGPSRMSPRTAGVAA